ncbi:cupin domain-containing protein [Halosquirtibacter xylanolyticus]|uniref:cupin domain-containing protein n=1 Tax=Halosquirtibacter xylanolyticus TaxID=3374599 RepID=UPI00374A4EEE|nr:cupin domain-containing protein [Prolixibacteraceae bacterium]
MNNSSIGQRIMTLRETLQIEKENLCERSQLTVEHLEKIEADNHTPSISTLIRISRALGVRVGTFLDDSKNIGPVLSRKGEENKQDHISMHPVFDNHKVDYMPMASNKAGRHMEPFLINLEEGQNTGYQKSSHEGEEFIYVLEGSVNIEYGKENYHLKQGESIYYDSIVEHRISTTEANGAKVLANIYTPY